MTCNQCGKHPPNILLRANCGITRKNKLRWVGIHEKWWDNEYYSCSQQQRVDIRVVLMASL